MERNFSCTRQQKKCNGISSGGGYLQQCVSNNYDEHSITMHIFVFPYEIHARTNELTVMNVMYLVNRCIVTLTNGQPNNYTHNGKSFGRAI